MARKMWITNAKAVARKVLPARVRRTLKPLVGMMDYRVKARRESPTDYVAAFDHSDIGRARRSILWHDDWDEATAATIRIFKELDVVGEGRTVIDYGAGIGRISKAIVECFAVNKVLAVDRSKEMRDHALDYLPAEFLDHGKIELLSDTELMDRVESLAGKVDALLFIEVLHHIPEPVLDDILPRLMSTLSPRGKLFVIGNELLDVDSTGATGKKAKRIAEFLPKHVDIVRQNVRTEVQLESASWSFYAPRHVFVCSARSVPAKV
ncbi:MAG: class I SAM-dependent methyltransferase [Chloroflexi bacterium]|nr:class I SAM-dependent methyltransferase [Chloroflexota bacterium]